MKAFCGDYLEDRPSSARGKSFLLRVVLLCMGLVLVAAAAPAIRAYYWGGQDSEATLPVDEALVLARDANVPLAIRRSAVVKLYASASELILTLQELKTVQGSVGDDAVIYVDKLIKETRK